MSFSSTSQGHLFGHAEFGICTVTMKTVDIFLTGTPLAADTSGQSGGHQGFPNDPGRMPLLTGWTTSEVLTSRFAWDQL